MPLPKEGSVWPPVGWGPAFDRYRFNEAIWLTDTESLQALFTGGQVDDTGRRAGTARSRRLLGLNLLRRWNWARQTPWNEKRTDLPVPIGRSVAELSGAMLMSEPPMFRLVTRDESTGKAKVAKGKQQDRLELLAASDDARMTLIEAAQTASAIGGVVLKAQWDKGDPDRESVWFDAVGADCAIPEFNTAGRLVGVLLWQEYEAKGQRVYRHFERHAPGVVEHALYLGTAQGVGRQVPLDSVDALSGLLKIDGADSDGFVQLIPTGIDRLTAQFWRNRPAIAWRRAGELANLGRSDFEANEPAIDAYSEAWGGMMRDVRLGKARLLVPQGMLSALASDGRGGDVFDPDRELYQEVGNLDPEASTNSLKDWQPAIRWQEHMAVLAALKLEILDGAGWSLSSYGNSSGIGEGAQAVTATEVVDRTTKSERTRDEKALYFRQAGQPFFRMLLELDALLYPGAGGGDFPELSIDFPDVSQIDPDKQATTFASLRAANAISIEQTVRERRPNWDDDEVEAEVTRILNDLDRVRGGAAADPTTIGRPDLTDPAGAGDGAPGDANGSGDQQATDPKPPTDPAPAK